MHFLNQACKYCSAVWLCIENIALLFGYVLKILRKIIGDLS
ncbi:hypothetical protein PPIS_a0061 [Pseudoalteromonas piscicida]|uniref:Uncharacterized protein n=1 Tax=Pseudoalteromonas piscicida TaxID=43662 RepID=A0ABN5C726_PSEO7|nr:hypothetical protein PPIS_a0061 [Pseudoalteromonas piscicida]